MCSGATGTTAFATHRHGKLPDETIDDPLHVGDTIHYSLAVEHPMRGTQLVEHEAKIVAVHADPKSDVEWVYVMATHDIPQLSFGQPKVGQYATISKLTIDAKGGFQWNTTVGKVERVTPTHVYHTCSTEEGCGACST